MADHRPCTAGTRVAFPGWGRIAYLLAAVPINMAVGMTIAFTSEVLYSYYASVPRIWGLTVMQDQKFAGALMWVPGTMMFILAALIVLASLFPSKGDAPELPVGWDSDGAMIAPGLEHHALPRNAHPARPCGSFRPRRYNDLNVPQPAGAARMRRFSCVLGARVIS